MKRFAWIAALILATVLVTAAGPRTGVVPALNLSHVACVDGQVEIHFVLVHSGSSGTPGDVHFGWTPYGTASPSNHTGDTWHFYAYYPSGTVVNLSWAYVTVPSSWSGDSTVWAGGSINDFNKTYNCATATPTKTNTPTETFTPSATVTPDCEFGEWNGQECFSTPTPTLTQTLVPTATNTLDPCADQQCVTPDPTTDPCLENPQACVTPDAEVSPTATQGCEGDCVTPEVTATPKPRRHPETGGGDIDLMALAVGGLITLGGAAVGFWGMRRRAN